MGIGTIEQWLWKAQKILHYNHVWILEMEFQLVVAYSRLIEDILCQSTADCAKHKLRPMRERVVQMTMHLLEVRKNHQNKTSFENTVNITQWGSQFRTSPILEWYRVFIYLFIYLLGANQKEHT